MTGLLTPNIHQMGGLPNNYNYEFGNNSIGNFYKNSHVFITGGTGFVGKALLEKILRSCPEVQGIYLLMRPKKGKNIQERLEELLKNPVFGRLKEENFEALKKIKPIAGDISQLNLGLGNKELSILRENVNIVFHSAATVKFNENLNHAFIYNTLATKRMLDFCCNIVNLKSFVYVSTAFSNTNMENISESVYTTQEDPEAIFTILDDISKGAFEIFEHKLMGNHPNTYTFTKEMAEQIVAKYSEKIPCVIVRPSIITAAWKEPYPGWVDSISGITGIFMECGRGTIKSIYCNENYNMDIIPVDIVVNTLITCAWHITQFRSNSLKVYNCVSGQINPITWKYFKHLTLKYSRESPSKYVTWYPGFTYRTNRLLHILFAIAYHIIPSTILDIYLYCTKKKPIMLRISTKFFDALLAGSFVAINRWSFQVFSMKSLTKAVNGASDGKNFDTDISNDNGFEWDEYVKHFNLGVRQYILKDDITSLEPARKKLQRLYWFQKLLEIFSVCLLVRLCLPYINNWMYELNIY